jgi:hypothetical protein
MKIYYPKSHIITNLYTSGKEWMLNDNTEYIGYYHKYIDGIIMTGAVFDKATSKKLIPYVSKVDQPNSIIYDKLIKKATTVAPKYVLSIPTTDEYAIGKITRYFLRRRNFSSYQDIIEIDKAQFKLWSQSDSGIDNKLYNAVEVDWKLTGPLNDIVEGNNTVYGVEDTNKRTVMLKDYTFYGLKNYLTDYTELSIYSPYVSQTIKDLFVSTK